MTGKGLALCGLLVMVMSGVKSQSGTQSMAAVKVLKAPVVDGNLNDEAWLSATPVGDFTVCQPEFGKPSQLKTEIRLVYTNEAVYVGAMLYDDPAKMRRQLTSRDGDEMQDTDKFAVLFDTYHDKQNGFFFLVTPSNVQTDVRISSAQGSGSNGYDTNWDAVWDSKVTVTPQGWVVEMKIPYMSLRFAPTDVQDWGINFLRFTRRNNENSHWNAVDPKISGFVNQSGTLTGLKDLQPPLRLSFLPYLSTGFRSVPTAKSTANSWLRNGGMDVKYGVNESFTLDLTLIPDFGQVQSDNVILNLSPYEVQFQENRPFFTEGTDLFTKAGIFYSRRVGGVPAGYYRAFNWANENNYTLQKNPAATQLYNASKFSGRTQGNLGVGVFNAVTAPMQAMATNDKGEQFFFKTEPLSNYNIIVLDQALKNRSSVSFTNTNVTRNGHARDANVSALDLSFFDKSNTYNLKIRPRVSVVTGADPHKGWKNVFSFDKVSGSWQWGIGNNIESPRYDHNDLGILQAPNEVSASTYLSWQQFKPDKKFNYRSYRISMQYQMLYEPFVFTGINTNANFLHVFKNFWDISLRISGQPTWQNDYFEMRTPGRLLKKTPWFFAGISGSTDSRKPFLFRLAGGYANLSPVRDDAYYNYQVGLRNRFGPKFSLDADMRKEDDKGNIGFAYFNNGEPVAGRRYVKSMTSILSGNYNFRARMNLTMRARHYWSNVIYNEFYNVNAQGWFTPTTFKEGLNRNFNAFNMDAFYTWDFKPGSRVVLSWKNALGPEVNISGDRFNKYPNNAGGIFTNPHSNEISVRFVYFLDYLGLVKPKSAANS